MHANHSQVIDCRFSGLSSRGFHAFSEERDGADVASGHALRAGTATAPPGSRQDNFGGPRQWDVHGGDHSGYNTYSGNALG